MAIMEIGLVALVIVIVRWLHRKPPNFPDGPKGIPFLGLFHLVFSNKMLHVNMAALRTKYGSMASLPMGLKGYGLILNDYKSIKEAIVHQGDVFAGRPDDFLNKKFFSHGIIAANGQMWKDKRRFTLHHMRDFGFGKNSMEAIIMAEVEKVMEFFHSKKKLVIDTQESDFLFLPILNVIWGIVAGKKYAMNDAKMQGFGQILQTFLQDFQDVIALNVLPSLRFLPKLRTSYLRMLKLKETGNQFVEDEYNEHTRTYKEGEARDFMDVYLAEIYKQEKSDQPNPAFEEKQLLGIIFELFGAGVETTKYTLMWSFLYMITWPEIQNKVQDELDAVIGQERFPQYSDRPQLPYTEAVLLEVQRYASVVPISVPRTPIKDTTLMGYDIPKGTFVAVNLWAVHNDKEYWGDPEIFRPERFLKEDGKVERPEYLIPFSAGPRSCLGEPLARMELFLFFATIMQRYSLRLATGVPHPGLEPVHATNLRPRPYSLSVKKRF